MNVARPDDWLAYCYAVVLSAAGTGKSESRSTDMLLIQIPKWPLPALQNLHFKNSSNTKYSVTMEGVTYVTMFDRNENPNTKTNPNARTMGQKSRGATTRANSSRARAFHPTVLNQQQHAPLVFCGL